MAGVTGQIPSAGASGAAKRSGVEVPGQAVEAAIGNFVDLIGPLGMVIARNALSRLGHSKGAPLDENDYSSFLATLSDELSDEQKSDFLGRSLVQL